MAEMPEPQRRLAELLQADIIDAEEELANLKRRQVEIEDEIDQLEWLIEHESELLKERFGIKPERESGPPSQVDLSGLSMSRGALLVLREAGRPMHVREIVEELRRRGKVLTGKTPERSISAVLHQSDQVIFRRQNRFEARPEATKEGAEK